MGIIQPLHVLKTGLFASDAAASLSQMQQTSVQEARSTQAPRRPHPDRLFVFAVAEKAFDNRRSPAGHNMHERAPLDNVLT